MLKKFCRSLIPTCCENSKHSLDEETPFFPNHTRLDQNPISSNSSKRTQYVSVNSYKTCDGHYQSVQQAKYPGNSSSTVCSLLESNIKLSFHRLPVNQLFLLERSPYRIISLIRHHFKETDESSVRLILSKSPRKNSQRNTAFQSCLNPSELSRRGNPLDLTALRSPKVRSHVSKKFREKTVLIINMFCNASEFIHEVD
jgi:hypothetical protein